MKPCEHSPACLRSRACLSCGAHSSARRIGPALRLADPLRGAGRDPAWRPSWCRALTAGPRPLRTNAQVPGRQSEWARVSSAGGAIGGCVSCAKGAPALARPRLTRCEVGAAPHGSHDKAPFLRA